MFFNKLNVLYVPLFTDCNMKRFFNSNFLIVLLVLPMALAFTTAHSQLDELSQALGVEELSNFSTPDAAAVDPNALPEYINQEELDTLTKLKEERITEIIKKQIEELENPKLIQRPNSFELKPQPKLTDQDLKYFGYDLFFNAPTTFLPIEDMPIPQDHILGPGDQLKVMLYGTINQEWTREITRDGFFLIKDIGPVLLAGLTFQEAKQRISEVVSGYTSGLQAYVSMGALRSIQVFVVGEGYQPGTYTLSSMSTLTNALFASGGIRTEGSLRDIQVRRNGTLIQSFDFYDFLLKGDNSKDIALRSGDVIFIPPVKNTIGISGEVRRPGIFELKDGETIADLLLFAGGLLSTADPKITEVEKVIKTNETSGFTRKNIDLSEEGNADTMLNDGDILNVYPIINTMQDVILVTGYTQKPGFYPWKESLRITDIIRSTSDLLPETDRNYIVIKREDQVTGLFSALQIDLDEVLSGDIESDANIILKPRDEILFFSKKASEEEDNLQDDEMGNNQMKINPDRELIVVKNNKIEVIERSEYQAYQSEGYRAAEFLIKPGSSNISDIVNNDLEMVVVKDNEVEVIARNLLPQYEDQGFVPAEFNSQLTQEINMNELIEAGDRQVILEPFMSILKRQSSSSMPKQLLTIDGNVHFPGEYPLTLNMDLKQILDAAGGLEDRAFVEDIELTRKTIKNNKYEITRLNLSGLNNQTQSTKLQPGDEILIKAIEDVQKYAEVKGEVYFPGWYPLQDGDTMSDLINRAGGLKETAFNKGAVFLREAIKKSEQQRLSKATARLQRELILGTTQVGLGTENQTANALAPVLEILDTSNEEELAIGRLVIDLDGILNGQLTDIILEDGDSLAIPKEMQSISVIGEVFVPTSHLFNDELEISDYINLSGGTTKFADLNSSYLVKANGEILIGSESNNGSFFRGARNTLEPGDTIVVPVETSQFNTFKAANDITQIIYQMALTAAAVNSFD